MRAKNLFYLSIPVLLLTACNTSTSKDSQTESSQLDSSTVPVSEMPAEVVKTGTAEGYYVGDFEAEKVSGDKVPMMTNRINISIDSLKDGVLFGHSVVAGNLRPFKGLYELNNGRYDVQVKEPGDDQYDGKFNFIIDLGDGRLQGKWFANNKNISVPERSFRLSKVTFRYDPELSIESLTADVFNISNTDAHAGEHITEDAGKVNASTTLLAKADVENMYKRDLEVMRNAIYARHGYSFKNREMRDFFDKNVDWYIPVSTDVTKELTELEKKNIALIKRYEQHAETYYDSFGR
jgi:hypothetical protein